MTEVKGLSEQAPDLNIDEQSKDFLTNPLRKDFMTEFSLGSNKLQFYGNPIFMARYSELIKTSLTTLAASKPPHELLTSGVVLERPMSALWLMMNGYEYEVIKLPVLEVLHLYRLTHYFGINREMTKDIGLNLMRLLSSLEPNETKQFTDKDKTTIEQLLAKPQDIFINLLIRLYIQVVKPLDLPSKHITTEILRQFIDPDSKKPGVAITYLTTIVGLLNQFLSKPEDIKWEIFLSPDALKDRNKAEIQKRVILNMFNQINRYGIESVVNYSQVEVDLFGETYAQKYMQKGNLGRLNPEWKYDPEYDTLTRGSPENNMFIELHITYWSLTRIGLETTEEENVDQLLNGEPLLQPILP